MSAAAPPPASADPPADIHAFRLALEENAREPEGPGRNAGAERLLAEAEQTGRTEFVVEALIHLLQTYNFSSEQDKMFVPFARLLRMWDERPEDFDEQDTHSLFWMFKWVSSGMTDQPHIPLAAMEKWLAEMEHRYRLAGHSERAVRQAEYHIAEHVGDDERAARAYAAWRAAERDPKSDCHACELRGQGCWEAGHGDDAAALELWRPVLDGVHTCAHEPHATLAESLLPLLRLGRLEEARANHLRGHRLVRRMESMRFAFARHVEFCALTGNEARGLELLAERPSYLTDRGEPSSLMAYLAVTTLLMRRLERLGLGGERVVGPPAADGPGAEAGAGAGADAAGEWTVAGLRAYAEREALALAARFDARNGTAAVSTNVRERMSRAPLTDRLPLGLRRTRPPRRRGAGGAEGPAAPSGAAGAAGAGGAAGVDTAGSADAADLPEAAPGGTAGAEGAGDAAGAGAAGAGGAAGAAAADSAGAAGAGGDAGAAADVAGSAGAAGVGGGGSAADVRSRLPELLVEARERTEARHPGAVRAWAAVARAAEASGTEPAVRDRAEIAVHRAMDPATSNEEAAALFRTAAGLFEAADSPGQAAMARARAAFALALDGRTAEALTAVEEPCAQALALHAAGRATAAQTAGTLICRARIHHLHAHSTPPEEEPATSATEAAGEAAPTAEEAEAAERPADQPPTAGPSTAGTADPTRPPRAADNPARKAHEDVPTTEEPETAEPPANQPPSTGPGTPGTADPTRPPRAAHDPARKAQEDVPATGQAEAAEPPADQPPSAGPGTPGTADPTRPPRAADNPARKAHEDVPTTEEPETAEPPADQPPTAGPGGSFAGVEDALVALLAFAEPYRDDPRVASRIAEARELQADLAARRGDMARAAGLYEEAVRGYAAAGVPWYGVQAEASLANVAVRLGDRETAERAARGALAHGAAHASPAGRASLHLQLADTLCNTGRDAEGVEHLLEAAHWADEAGDSDGMGAWARHHLGGALLRLGRPAEAATVLEGAIADLAVERHGDGAVVQTRWWLGDALRQLGEQEQAAEQYLSAAEITAGWEGEGARDHAVLATLAAQSLSAAEIDAQADRAYERAAVLWRDLGDVPALIRTLRARAWLAVRPGREGPEAARELMAEAERELTTALESTPAPPEPAGEPAGSGDAAGAGRGGRHGVRDVLLAELAATYRQTGDLIASSCGGTPADPDEAVAGAARAAYEEGLAYVVRAVAGFAGLGPDCRDDRTGAQLLAAWLEADLGRPEEAAVRARAVLAAYGDEDGDTAESRRGEAQALLDYVTG